MSLYTTTNEVWAELSRLTELANARQLDLILRIVMMAFRALVENASIDALCLAFGYGRAKGVRAAQNRAAK